jgi:hypothetical protein
MDTHYFIEWLLFSAVIVIVNKMRVKCNVHEGNDVMTTMMVVVVVIYYGSLSSITLHMLHFSEKSSEIFCLIDSCFCVF